MFCVCFFCLFWDVLLTHICGKAPKKVQELVVFCYVLRLSNEFWFLTLRYIAFFLGWLVESQHAAHLMGEPKMTAAREHDISAWSKIPIHPRKMTNSLSNSSLNHGQPPG